MRLRSAGLALLAVAVLTGCGSVSASLIDLRQDAGRICRRTNKSFKQLPALPAQGQSVAFLQSGLARLRVERAELARLTPPHDVADIYRAAVAALDQELGALAQAVKTIHRGQDPAIAFKALKQQLTPLLSQADNAWEALEIPDCSQ